MASISPSTDDNAIKDDDKVAESETELPEQNADPDTPTPPEEDELSRKISEKLTKARAGRAKTGPEPLPQEAIWDAVAAVLTGVEAVTIIEAPAGDPVRDRWWKYTVCEESSARPLLRVYEQAVGEGGNEGGEFRLATLVIPAAEKDHKDKGHAHEGVDVIHAGYIINIFKDDFQVQFFEADGSTFLASFKEATDNLVWFGSLCLCICLLIPIIFWAPLKKGAVMGPRGRSIDDKLLSVKTIGFHRKRVFRRGDTKLKVGVYVSGDGYVDLFTDATTKEKVLLISLAVAEFDRNSLKTAKRERRLSMD